MNEFHIANAQYSIALEEFNVARLALQQANELGHEYAEEDFYRAHDCLKVASDFRAIAMQTWLYPKHEVVQ